MQAPDAAKGPKVWTALARKMGPRALRMNLNTLLRHDVFSVEQLSSTVSEAGTNFTSDKRLGQSFYNMVDYVADQIADESEIRRGKQFPYQYFAAYLNAVDDVPQKIKTAPTSRTESQC